MAQDWVREQGTRHFPPESGLRETPWAQHGHAWDIWGQHQPWEAAGS